MKSRYHSYLWIIRILGVFILTVGMTSPVFAAETPAWTITKTHVGDFAQGDQNKVYTITVTNSGGAPTSGTITVTDTVPTGLIPQTITSGDPAWTCPTGDISGLTVLTCTRTAVMNESTSSVITLTVDVAVNAGQGADIEDPIGSGIFYKTVTNSVTVSGGGSLDPDTDNDVTRILQMPDLVIDSWELRNEANNAVITNPQPDESFWIRMTVRNRGGRATGLFYPGVFLDGKPNYGQDHDPLGEVTNFSGYRISPAGSLNFPKGCLYYDPAGTIDPLTTEIIPERGNYTRIAFNDSLDAGASTTIDVQIAYPAPPLENSEYNEAIYDTNGVRYGLKSGNYQVYLYVDPNCSGGDEESYEDNNVLGPIPITVGDAPVGGPANGTSTISSSQALVATGRLHMDDQITAYNSDPVGNTNVSVPMLFKNQFGGGYDSALYVQNTSNTAANVTINYFDVYGAFTCAVNDTIPGLSARSYWLPNVSCLPDPWSGGVNITSSQPITALGRSHIGEQVTSYNDFAAGSTTMYVPMLFKNQFGGSYNSALYVQNMSSTNPAHITITFYDVYGNYTGAMNDTLQPLSATGYWIPNREILPVVWSGGAVVTSDQPIVAIGRPHIGTQVTAYNGFAAGSNTVNVPMLFKNKPGTGGSYSSAVYVQNVDPANPATITVNFYDDDGTLRGSLVDVVLPSLSSTGFWLPAREFLPEGWSGSAIVTSNRPIVALGRLHVDEEIMTYNGSAGSPNFYVPVLFKDDFNGTNYDTNLVLQNPQNLAASVSVSLYTSTGSLACIKNEIIAPYASANFWLNDSTCP